MESELYCVMSGILCEGSEIRVTIWYFGAHSGIT